MRLNNWTSISPIDNLKLITINKKMVNIYIKNKKPKHTVKEEKIGDKIIYYVYLCTDAHC